MTLMYEENFSEMKFDLLDIILYPRSNTNKEHKEA